MADVASTTSTRATSCPTAELFLAKDQVRAYARAVDQWLPRFTDDEGARREGPPGHDHARAT